MHTLQTREDAILHTPVSDFYLHDISLLLVQYLRQTGGILRTAFKVSAFPFR